VYTEDLAKPRVRLGFGSIPNLYGHKPHVLTGHSRTSAG
jgi:hypothetical protein